MHPSHRSVIISIASKLLPKRNPDHAKRHPPPRADLRVAPRFRPRTRRRSHVAGEAPDASIDILGVARLFFRVISARPGDELPAAALLDQHIHVMARYGLAVLLVVLPRQHEVILGDRHIAGDGHRDRKDLILEGGSRLHLITAPMLD